MRQTCLKCGHQVELSLEARTAPSFCVCGCAFGQPCVVSMGVQPSMRAAEQLRARAFRAAGLVRNVGGLALLVALCGFVIFPLGLLGAALGLWVILSLKGPIGYYSGRTAAIWAVVLGLSCFVGEGILCWHWLEQRQQANVEELQRAVSEDLRDLLRAQRLYHATTERFGSFSQLHFRPRHGQYTLYLGTNDLLPAHRKQQPIIDPLPADLPAVSMPGVLPHAFIAVAVANLDDDPDLDVWIINQEGNIAHVRSDAAIP